MQKTKRFGKDFILVIIGQIISLFGNAVLRLHCRCICLIRPVRPRCWGLFPPAAFCPWWCFRPWAVSLQTE